MGSSNFSKVGLLLNLFCTGTIVLTFEKFLQVRVCTRLRMYTRIRVHTGQSKFLKSQLATESTLYRDYSADFREIPPGARCTQSHMYIHIHSNTRPYRAAQIFQKVSSLLSELFNPMELILRKISRCACARGRAYTIAYAIILGSPIFSKVSLLLNLLCTGTIVLTF